jgi:L-alanine-DL-glutamate epimerase-like enolase superfamily enzyme
MSVGAKERAEMRLAKVSCDFLSVPVRVPVKETTRDFGVVLVRLETNDGFAGVGLARPSDARGQAVRSVVLDDIAPFLARQGRLVSPGRFWHEAGFALLTSDYRAATGVVAGAAGAVDQALWDILGKTAGQPVYRLLGGAQDEIEAYATFGLNAYTPEEETEAAKLVAERGFRTFKLQGTDADRGQDIEHAAGRVRRLRETVGPDAGIILDGHNRYTPYQAAALAKLVEPYDLAFLDEPLHARDHVALRRLKASVPWLPLAGRGRTGDVWDSRDLADSGCLDVMGTNVIDQGGFCQGVKIAHLAELRHLPLVTGGAFHHPNAHLIAAVTNGWMTEYHTLAAALTEYLFPDCVRPVGGMLRLGDRPGLGLELDPDAFAEAKARGDSLRARQ